MIGIIAAAMTALIGVMVWYLKYQTRRQAKREDKHDAIQREERLFYRGLVTNDLKGLHQDSLKNTELNVQGITLQKEMIKDFKDHNGHAERFSEKVIETLNHICDKMRIVNINDRRKKNKMVRVDRRKNIGK